jgi:arylsulfatase A-like enzyme
VRSWGPSEMRTSALTALLLLAILSATACGREQTVFLRVADLLPVLELQVGTEQILPATGFEIPELGWGWAGRFSSGSQPRSSVRVRARKADLHIIAASPGDLELTLEVRALSQPDGGPQTMTILLQGSPLGSSELGSTFATVSQTLPAELLRPGRNLVTLEFATVGPIDPEDGTVAGPARVRNLKVRTSTGRPSWPDRPAFAAAAVERGQGAEHGSVDQQIPTDPDLQMPTDSVLNLALEVPEGARIAAELTRHLAGQPQDGDDAPRDIVASIELIDAAGVGEILYEHRFGGSSPGSANPETLDLPLDRWVGTNVLLRLKVWGGVNGHVLWQNLRITCACESSPPPYMACDLPQVPSSGQLGRPDIFFIILDAARADAFSTYGADRPTPYVDRLAAEGTQFTRAYAPSSWTSPSTASLLTGRYPDAHGVQEWDQRLSDSIPTVTQMLAEAGYYTFLGTQHLVYQGNLPERHGFEEIEQIDHSMRSKLPGPDSLFVPDRPTFALIHLMPPHSPYMPPPPYWDRYAEDPSATFEDVDPALNDYYRLRKQASEEFIRNMRDRYDENVAYADALVGRILEMLRDQGRYDDAMVILLSDHGEAFFEHETFLHRKTLHQEVLRIPLVIKWPAGASGFSSVIEQPVSLVDLVPTLVDGLGVSDLGAQFQGVSLLPAVFDDASTDRAVYAITRPSDQVYQPSRALYRGARKVILDENAAPHLYDLSLDPMEQNNKVRVEPVVTGFLLQELLAQQRCSQILLAGAGEVPQIELDPERLKELRALGYIQ